MLLKYLSYSFRNDKPITCNLGRKYRNLCRGKRSRDDKRTRCKKDKATSRRNDEEEDDRPPDIHLYVIRFTELIVSFCYSFERAYTPALRIFPCSSLLYGLVIVGLYNQHWLMWTLSKPVRYPEIMAIESVADSNYTIDKKYLNLKADRFIGTDPLETKLRNKMMVLNRDKPTNYFVFDRSVITLGRFTSIMLENYSIYYDDDGNKLVHVVEECPVTYTLSYVIRLNSPCMEKINTSLLRIQQFGFINFWYEKTTYPLLVEDEKMKLTLSEKEKKLTLEHYSLAFFVLFIGLTGCSLVFLDEIHDGKCRGF